jgi:hypothetical protein
MRGQRLPGPGGALLHPRARTHATQSGWASARQRVRVEGEALAPDADVGHR